MNTLGKVVLGLLASIGFLMVMLIVTLGIYGAKQVGDARRPQPRRISSC